MTAVEPLTVPTPSGTSQSATTAHPANERTRACLDKASRFAGPNEATPRGRCECPASRVAAPSHIRLSRADGMPSTRVDSAWLPTQAPLLVPHMDWVYLRPCQVPG